MSSVSLNSLISQAADELPFIRRRAYKRLLARPRMAAEIADHVAACMADEPCCSVIVAAANAGDFNGDVMLAIDPATLRAILDFIVKILPLIIQLFLGS